MEQIDILIPYVLGPDNGLELKFALRSIEANFQYGNYRIVIAGEKPDWLNNTAAFIPITRNTSPVNRNARDTMAKFRAFLDTCPENKEFILTYDDIYFSSPVTLSDIRMLIAADCFQKNPGHLKQAKAGTHWISLMEKTMNAVQKSGGSTFNYETHLPRIFDKNRFVSMIEQHSLSDQPLMVSTLYYNLFHKEEIPLLLCDANPGIRFLLRTTLDSPSLKSGMRSHRFTNNSPETWSPVLKKVLSEQFPYKSSFER